MAETSESRATHWQPEKLPSGSATGTASLPPRPTALQSGRSYLPAEPAGWKLSQAHSTRPAMRSTAWQAVDRMAGGACRDEKAKVAQNRKRRCRGGRSHVRDGGEARRGVSPVPVQRSAGSLRGRSQCSATVPTWQRWVESRRRCGSRQPGTTLGVTRGTRCAARFQNNSALHARHIIEKAIARRTAHIAQSQCRCGQG